MEEEGFWDDPAKSQDYMKELKNLKDTVAGYEALKQQFDDIKMLIEMGNEEGDEAIVPEIQAELDSFVNSLEDLRLSTLLNEEYDKTNAIMTLHAGAGGTEACDWASMLYRMYCKWADHKGYQTELLDFLEGDEAVTVGIAPDVSVSRRRDGDICRNKACQSA